ncbi:TPA: hypothetical protein H1012_01230 [archaeon]|nr:hypothetical protein [Candidatus Naiadarchaeales archaeon SRR2090159.bin1288]
MQIELPKETSKKVEDASKVLGLEKKDIINRALLLYLDNLQKYLELKKELKEWDSLSDEAILNFERKQ